MKTLSRIFAVLLVATLVAPRPAYSYVDKTTAVLRALNKAAGKTQVVRATVGQTTNVEKLAITIRSCKQTDPFEAENHYAFVEIADPAHGQIYGGWMNRNEPGQNPLQSPDWDIWLVACE